MEDHQSSLFNYDSTSEEDIIMNDDILEKFKEILRSIEYSSLRDLYTEFAELISLDPELALLSRYYQKLLNTFCNDELIMKTITRYLIALVNRDSICSLFLFSQLISKFKEELKKPNNIICHMNLYCFYEVNYLILIAFIKMMNEKNNSLYENDYISSECYEVNFKAKEIFSFIKPIFPAFLSGILQTNELLFTKKMLPLIKTHSKTTFKIELKNYFLSDLDCFFDFVSYLFKVIICSQEDEDEEFLCMMNVIVENLLRCLFAYLLINFNLFQLQFTKFVTSFSGIEQFLIFSTNFLDFFNKEKFDYDNEVSVAVRFEDIFNFNENLMILLLEKLTMKLDCVVSFIKNPKKDIKHFFNEVYINPRILERFLESLKDFVFCHLDSILKCDNNYEIIIRNSWLKINLEVLAMTKLLNKLNDFVIEKRIINNNQLELISNIFQEILFKEIKLYKLVLPRVLMIFKLTYCYHIIKNIFHILKELNHNVSSFLTSELIDELTQDINTIMSEHHPLIFYYCCRLKDLIHEDNKKVLRIYYDPIYPLSYIEFKEEDVQKAVRRSNRIKLKTNENFNTMNFSNKPKYSNIKEKETTFKLSNFPNIQILNYCNTQLDKVCYLFKDEGVIIKLLERNHCIIKIINDKGLVLIEDSESLGVNLPFNAMYKIDYEKFLLVLSGHVFEDENIHYENFEATFQFYDLDQKMAHDDIVRNLINLFEG